MYEEVGDDLRAVVQYDGTKYEMRRREDVREKYTYDESQRLVDDTVVDQISLPDTQRSFKAGGLHGLIRIFDEAWILSWPDHLPGKSGVMVSVQREGGTIVAY